MTNKFHEIGEQRHRTLLFLLAKFGQLRAADFAVLLGLGDPIAIKIAERSLRQLEAAGLVMRRTNIIGTNSYVLREAGVQKIHAECIYQTPKSGKDITPTGSTFLHRTISTLGVLVLVREALHCSGTTPIFYTEYEMQRFLAPLNMKGQFKDPNGNVHALKCAPDGIILTEETGMVWIEAEASYRAHARLDGKLQWLNEVFTGQPHCPCAEKSGRPFPRVLDEVVWVVPTGKTWYPHEERLRRVIRDLPQSDRGKWSILRLNVTPNLRLLSYSLDTIRSDKRPPQDTSNSHTQS